MDSIRNVDGFLYIRRKRRGSLTTAPDTHAKSPARLRLEESWCDAFHAVRDGAVALAASALAVESGPPNAAIVAIEPRP
jgi:hypothetical protein